MHESLQVLVYWLERYHVTAIRGVARILRKGVLPRRKRVQSAEIWLTGSHTSY